MKNIISVPILLASLIGCSNEQESRNKAESTNNINIVQMTDEQLNNTDIATGKIENKSISSVLKLHGTIEVPPKDIVSISFPLGGYLKSTNLIPGMPVKQGDIIAIMEDQQIIQLQQDYLTAKIKLAVMDQEFNRQKVLNQSKASSDKLFQQTQADYSSQSIMVNSLFQRLQLIGINPPNLNENNISRSANIYSPINGFISEVNVNIGKYVNPSDILFEIINPSDIDIVLNVFEKDINRLSIGQKVLAYTNVTPDRKYPAKIFLIGKELSKDRSVEVYCHLERYDKTLYPGMFMNAEIEVQTKNAWVLPTEAVVGFENKQYVFTVREKNEFEMLEIATGLTEKGFTEIIGTDQAAMLQATFVTKGSYSLLMKMKNTSDE
ncbi:MAG: efflux RND transporter periplasmic adaptor subunit [Bacteroidota bacterium]